MWQRMPANPETHLLFLLGTGLDHISQPPLQEVWSCDWALASGKSVEVILHLQAWPKKSSYTPSSMLLLLPLIDAKKCGRLKSLGP